MNNDEPPKLDFLWKDKQTTNIKSVCVANYLITESDVDYNYDRDIVGIDFFDKELQKVLKHSKENNRSILFIDAIGGYQTGKTTLFKAITRNTAHETGNGNEEQTHGVYIDGPYEIIELINGYGSQIELKAEIQTPHIYFIDIEGFNGFRNGNDSNISNNLYHQLAIPFVGLSAIHVAFLNDQKEGLSTFEQIFSTIQLSNLSIGSNAKENSKLIFCLKTVGNHPFDIDFEDINKISSDQVSAKFHEYYSQKLKQFDSTFQIRCLPRIDPRHPSKTEIPKFQAAYDIFVDDVFKMIIETINSGNSLYYDQVIERFNALIRTSVKIDITKNLILQQIKSSKEKSKEYLDKAIESIEYKATRNNKSKLEELGIQTDSILNESIRIFEESIQTRYKNRKEVIKAKNDLKVENAESIRDKMFVEIPDNLRRNINELIAKVYPEILTKLRSQIYGVVFHESNAKVIKEFTLTTKRHLRKELFGFIEQKYKLTPRIVSEVNCCISDFACFNIENDIRRILSENATVFRSTYRIPNKYL